jgi:ribonuclease P protein component
VRNRAKRRLREALARAELRDDTAYVVVASPEVVTAPFAEVEAWVRQGTSRPDRKE